MRTINFLTLPDIIILHSDLIEKYGGSPLIRDIGLLKSALAQPMAQFGGQYLHRDIFEMAGAYLFHIVLNHPFMDGNKRIGALAADTFLDLNGVTLNAPERKLGDMILGVAKGSVSKKEIVNYLRVNSKEGFD